MNEGNVNKNKTLKSSPYPKGVIYRGEGEGCWLYKRLEGPG